MRHLLVLIALSLAACSSSVAPTNPYDPATPAEQQTKGRLQGTLFLAGAGPAVDVTVFLRQDGSIVRQTATASDGAFLLDAVVPGSYSLEVSPTGFVPLSFPVVVKPGEVLEMGRVGLTAATASSVIEGTATLAGEVDHGGTLVEAVGRAYTAVTNSLGEFHLEVAEGTYTLRLSHKDFVTLTIDGVAVIRGEARNLDPVSLAANPATIRGHVDAELASGGSASLGNATVTLEGTGLTGFTDDAGDFSLTGVPPGSYVLRVFKSGYSQTSSPVLDLAGGEVRSLPNPFSLSLQRGGLRGTVLLADTADASGIVVDVAGTSRATVTGADGVFAFDGLLPGPYALSAHKDRYVRKDLGTWTVTAGTVATVSPSPPAVLTRMGGMVVVTNPASGYTNQLTVTLGLSAGGSPTAAQISEDPTFTTGVTTVDMAGLPQPVAASFTLDGSGVRTIYARFRDPDGGWSDTASARVTVQQDTPHVLLTVRASLADGTPSGTNLAGSSLVVLSLSVPPGDTALEMATAQGTACGSAWPATWFPLASSALMVLDPPEGLKTVCVRTRDAAGNESDDCLGHRHARPHRTVQPLLPRPHQRDHPRHHGHRNTGGALRRPTACLERPRVPVHNDGERRVGALHRHCPHVLVRPGPERAQRGRDPRAGRRRQRVVRHARVDCPGRHPSPAPEHHRRRDHRGRADRLVAAERGHRHRSLPGVLRDLHRRPHRDRGGPGPLAGPGVVAGGPAVVHPHRARDRHSLLRGGRGAGPRRQQQWPFGPAPGSAQPRQPTGHRELRGQGPVADHARRRRQDVPLPGHEPGGAAARRHQRCGRRRRGGASHRPRHRAGCSPGGVRLHPARRGRALRDPRRHDARGVLPPAPGDVPGPRRGGLLPARRHGGVAGRGRVPGNARHPALPRPLGHHWRAGDGRRGRRRPRGRVRPWPAVVAARPGCGDPAARLPGRRGGGHPGVLAPRLRPGHRSRTVRWSTARAGGRDRDHAGVRADPPGSRRVPRRSGERAGDHLELGPGHVPGGDVRGLHEGFRHRRLRRVGVPVRPGCGRAPVLQHARNVARAGWWGSRVPPGRC